MRNLAAGAAPSASNSSASTTTMAGGTGTTPATYSGALPHEIAHRRTSLYPTSGADLVGKLPGESLFRSSMHAHLSPPVGVSWSLEPTPSPCGPWGFFDAPRLRDVGQHIL
eukprot:6213003-Pleurochrysis_carterae.AAC.2